ncbi:MAG: pyridoxamine 5'-phosphate oxidase [Bergeyella sp.]|nr:pyridoxamine 5'-phosphate oxidase [Bergeyella sp.]
MEILHHKRKVYTQGVLLKSSVKQNPIDQFDIWYKEAEQNPQIAEANATALSTVEEDYCPRTRMVLLKAYSKEGFIFYTHYTSKKGSALKDFPKGCLLFFWPELERQIIMKCEIKKLPENLNDIYFDSRPRGSKLGALASRQSQVIPDRNSLDAELKRLEKKYENKEIPRPKTWGGYIASPYETEFWQGRENRLHDRILYTKKEDGLWDINRLAP